MFVTGVQTCALPIFICPNNTVAACATVDAIGRENEVMKHTLRAFAIVLALYMVLAMLYTCVLFPNYGM